MYIDTKWLEEFLSKERDEVLELLEDRHQALIASFETNCARAAWGFGAFDVDAACENLEAPSSDLGVGHPQNSPGVVEVKHAPKSRVDQPSVRRGQSTSCLLMNMFDLIDKNGDGKIKIEEFRDALQDIGENPARALKIVKHIEPLCRGNDSFVRSDINRDDWMCLVCGERRSQLDPYIFQLAEKFHERAKIKRPRFYLMLSSSSTIRLAWDCLCAICTIYVITFVPLWLSFGVELLFSDPVVLGALSGVDHLIDSVFIFDIILNFRTGYTTIGGREEFCWKKVGSHYLHTWFLLDVCSSIPVSFFQAERTGNVQSVKILKFARLFAIMRLLRTAKVFHILAESKIGEYLQESIIEYKLQTKIRICEIAVCLFAFCHWLACAMAACGLDFIISFIDESPNFDEVYIPAFYWAMTTCTTVGYGDITPKTNPERIIAMIAMCVGGTFYGIISGTFASIMFYSDRAKQERLAKMDVVNSWLQRQNFPIKLRRKIRYYFKSMCTNEEHCTKDELSVIEELTSQLRTEVSLVLVPDEVRGIPIFDSIPDFVTGFLVGILHVVSFKKHDVIVRAGESGASMYVVKAGHCEQEMSSNTNTHDESDIMKVQLCVGESFGEEVILSFVEIYEYTVLAIRRSDLYRIPKSPFLAGMEAYPEHLETMRNYFQSTEGHYARMSKRLSKRISLFDSTKSNLSDDFCDSVLADLRSLRVSIEEIRGTTSKPLA